ncbi:amidohydrolase 2 [Acidisarcina polymorpha]|uniref:Amidohydrolase 2 n=1 Tax=Acidisarcina polymorpha TaxID=2211140 RepID=A0A2Z5G802_9BACT|nr:amidohydrolase family protein [Acidisarcina polymorpha]AXC14947.1 amidohydrolase 2 [Acidisarcina polymorpha]
MNRRDLIKMSIGSAASFVMPRCVLSATSPIPIVDAHIHLFDTTRAEGVPWPEKSDTALYRPALPARYKTVTEGLGVVAAIAIEASPLASDNDWLLGIAAANPIIVGVVGDLIPGDPGYFNDLDRLHANPLFLGIRYGNLWKRNLLMDLQKPGFLAGLKRLAEANLVLESANPDLDLLRALSTIADHLPDLRIVIDHLPNATQPREQSGRNEYWVVLRHLAAHPSVYVKLSEIPAIVNGRLVTAPSHYKPGLDALWNIFGEDHVFFGSDWPNSDHVATYRDTLGIVRSYISQRSASAQEKYFWRNSIAAYRWQRRLPSQPA